ncbi:hypothetical protein AC578_2811 [Pseudocercospora eumusae]|uniref:Uncharacterized protein n=1 Tax=Pseudocercospora eumusae TaxID=321146 RepID=A0A139HGY5_9PEZI|nr:hypothetical protein AC578_2811 [Pseudocercospora eumusae]
MTGALPGRAKKSVTATVLFIRHCAGNAVGAQLFQDKDAPRYIPGLTGCGVFYGLESAMIVLWRA